MKTSTKPTEYLLIKAMTNSEWDDCNFAIININKDWKQNQKKRLEAVKMVENDYDLKWLNYADTLSDKRRLQAVAANYWRRHQLLPPIEVTADCQNVDFCRHQQIVFYHGYRICMVTDNRWRNKSAATPLYIDYLYLCKGYNGHLKELRLLFAPECIILDASLSEHRKQLFEEECKQSGLRFISLSEKGSVRFLL